MMRMAVWGFIWLLSVQFAQSNAVFLRESREFFAWRLSVFRDPDAACLKFEQDDAAYVCRRQLWHRSHSRWVEGCPEKSQDESFPRYWRLVLTCQFPFLFFHSRQLQWEHLLLE